MKKIVYILLWGVLLASCTKDPLSADADSGREVEMKLNISTKALDPGNDAISNVRIIVVNKHGDVKFNESTPVVAGTDEYIAVSRVGKNDFYVICNETPQMSAALNAIGKRSDVEAFKIAYTSEIDGSSPLVMYGEMREVTVESTNDEDPDAYTVTYTDAEGVVHTDTKLPIAVKRLAVKVSLSFIKSTPDFTVSDISIKVVKLPQYAYLPEGKAYEGEIGSVTIIKSSQGALLQDNKATFNQESKAFEYESESDVVVIDDLYLPEYIMASTHHGDIDYQTAIIVSGKCTTAEGQTIIGNWRIGLMDATNELPRNSWYKIAATIKGMGAIGLYAEIEEVAQHDISVNWKPQSGLVIVSDQATDYNKNINVWNDYNVYFGVLKAYNATTLAYTDILFKYGSVVATRGSEPQTVDGVTYTPAFDATQDIVWEPGNLSQRITSWADIPYLTDGANVPDNAGNIPNGLGDPCKLVTLSAEQIDRGVVDNGLWHMATAKEYKQLIDANDGIMEDTRGYHTFHKLLIPNTRVRNEHGVLSNDAAGTGEYWSSGQGSAFEFTSATNQASITPYAGSNLSKGYTVRCVRNTIPPSTLSAGSSTISYTGGQNDILIKSNLTHWTATLITKSNAEPDETPSDDTSLQFIGAISGSKDGKITVSIDYTPTKRTFYIRVTGIGLDGTKHKKIATVIQYAGSIRFNTLFEQELPKLIPGSGYEATVTCNMTPYDPDRVPIPPGKHLWVEVRVGSTYGKLILDSRVGTEGGLGMLVVPGTYQYKITFQIPANPNIDARTLYIRIASDSFGESLNGTIAIVQENQ